MSSVGDELSDPASSIDENEDNLHPLQPQLHDEDLPISSSFGLPTQLDGTNDDSDLGEGDDRANRFHGLSSTWHAYTHEERALAASLDQLRANDLSVHLYNAHALKSRLRTSTEAESWHGKSSWTKPDEDGKRPWQPDADWTAWPLAPERVPRSGEIFGAPPKSNGDDETYRKHIPWSPSADIEDEIKAMMLRKAKVRYEARPLVETSSSRHPRAIHHIKVDNEDAHDVDMMDYKTGIIDSRPDSEYDNVTPGQETMKAVLLADDELADAMMKPSARNIVTKLDDLLLGLQKSRRAHRQRKSTSRSRSQSVAAYSRSQSQSNAKEPSKSTGKGQKRRRVTSESNSDDFRSPDESEMESDDDSRANSRANTPKRTRPSGDSKHPLGQRDWSEVLGMAALVGWDPAIVDRAARRCASLFGEGMSFRTMPETAATATSDRKLDYTPEMLPSIETDDDHDDEVPSALQGYFCPFADCPRHHQAYDRGFRWREHLKRGHELTKAQIAEIESALPDSRAASHAPVLTFLEDEMLEDAITDEDKTSSVHTDGFLIPIPTSVGGAGNRSSSRQRERRSLKNEGSESE